MADEIVHRFSEIVKKQAEDLLETAAIQLQWNTLCFCNSRSVPLGRCGTPADAPSFLVWIHLTAAMSELLALDRCVSPGAGTSMSDDVTNRMEICELLRELEFLRGVPDENVQELAELAAIVDFPVDAVVFRNGEPALCSYLIVDGRVLLEICGPAIGCAQVLTIGNGELLGCSPVLGQATLTATARTLAPTRAIALQGSEVVNWCERNPRFGYQFMRCTALALAKRLTATRLQLLDLYRTEPPTPPRV